jgi:hypothetical protein
VLSDQSGTRINIKCIIMFVFVAGTSVS